MKVPFLDLKRAHVPILDALHKAAIDVIDSGYYVLGPQVEAFEQEYAAFNNTKFSIGVSNGLDALVIALKSLGITKGDEVIVPSNTYIASWLAISATGARIVPVEPNELTANLDPSKVFKAITSKTKAIMPVHLYGQSCEMSSIMQIAEEYGLFVIEDNAQSQGATCDGKLTGSFGHISGTSFYPGKNLGALGDAGAITTDDSKLAAQAMMRRNYGSTKKYYNTVRGMNTRLDEIQAAMLRIKLRELPKWSDERRSLAAVYDRELADLKWLKLPHTAAGCTHVFHLYAVRTTKRDEFQNYLNEKGIGTIIHYPVPPHKQKAYFGYGLRASNYPIAEEWANTGISLPLFIGMTEEEIKYVCDTIKAFKYDQA